MKNRLNNGAWILFFILGTVVNAHAFDVVIIDNGGSNTNGSFSGGVWTPTGSPSIIDYGNFLTQLAANNITIGTNGAGSISFEEPSGDFVGFGYDFAVDRTLTLYADGDVSIILWGISPTLPANIGKLHVVINGTGDGNLVVSGQGIRTNGGDVTVTGFDKAFLNQNAIKTNGAVDYGDIDISVNVFKLGFDKNNVFSSGGDIVASNVEIDASDSIELRGFSFQLIGGLELNTDDIYYEAGNFIFFGPLPVSPGTDKQFIINANTQAAKYFQIDWKSDISLTATDSLCLQGFNIRDLTPDHETDLKLEAGFIQTTYGEIQLFNGLGTSKIEVTSQSNIKMGGTTFGIVDGDADVDITAIDSIYFYGAPKGSSGTTGSKVTIQRGNGTIDFDSKFVSLVYAENSIREGSGSIKVAAEGDLSWYYSQAQIDGPDDPSVLPFKIEVEADKLYFSSSEISISDNDTRGLIDIDATTLFRSTPAIYAPGDYNNGGYIGYGRDYTSYYEPMTYNYISSPDEVPGFGDIMINAGRTEMRYLFLGDLDGEGEGNIYYNGDVAKFTYSSMEVADGNIEFLQADSISWENAEMRVKKAGDDNNITIHTNDLAMISFMVVDTAFNNSTNIDVQATNGYFQYGEFNIRNGNDANMINLDFDETLRFVGVSATLDRGDGMVNVAARDSMFLLDNVRGYPSSYTGGRIGIREGNGSIKIETYYLFEQYFETGIMLGNGRIDKIADQYYVGYAIPAHIVGPEAGGQTKGDTINIQTRVYNQGYAEISISRNEQPSYINLVATDSLNAGYGKRRSPSNSSSTGGFIGFGASYKSGNLYYYLLPSIGANIDSDNAKANGDLNIEAGILNCQYLYMGQKAGDGDISMSTTGDCLMVNSSFEQYGENGDLWMDVGGKLKIVQSEVAQKQGTGNLNVSVQDSLLIYQGSVMQSANGDGIVDVEGDIYLTYAKISHQGNNSYSPNGQPNEPYVDAFAGNLYVSANALVLPRNYNYGDDAFQYSGYSINNSSSNAQIASNVTEGDLMVMIEDSIYLENGAIEHRIASGGSGSTTVRAGKLSMKQSAIFENGGQESLKVQIDDIDMEFAGIEAKEGSSKLIVAGQTLDSEYGCIASSGGDVNVNFDKDINLVHTYLGSMGGDMSINSAQGAVNAMNGDHPDNNPEDTDGIFTGNSGVNGGNLSISACTGINIASDLHTGEGSGGGFTEMGANISSIAGRRTLGQGNISLSINETCLMHMAIIEDPCYCQDPFNIFGPEGVLYFHEKVIITGLPGDTWELTTVADGAVLNEDGEEITDLSSLVPQQISDNGSVQYVFEFFHAPNVGYSVVFEATDGPSFGQYLPIQNLCTDTCPNFVQDLPALPRWSLFLLVFIVIGIGSFMLMRNNQASNKN